MSAARADGRPAARRRPSPPVRLVRALARLPVRAYMRWISPWTPPTCRFRPTCSAYADEALELHGLWRGGWLAARRILRCHAFSDPGVDPVPGGRLDDPRVERLERGLLRARRPTAARAAGPARGDATEDHGGARSTDGSAPAEPAPRADDRSPDAAARDRDGAGS